MSILKIPNPAYPNVILHSDPKRLDFGNGRGGAIVRYKVRNRCTAYGAWQDAVCAIPHFISTTLANALELQNQPGWTSCLPVACVPVMWRQSVTVEEVVLKDRSCWIATATYGAVCDPLDEAVSYSTQGSTEIIRIPRETYVAWEVLDEVDLDLLEVAGAVDPDGKEIQYVPDPGGINVGHDGEVLGCERYVPELRLQLQKCFEPGTLAACDSIDFLYQLDGCVNEIAWRCFGPREIQFQGVDADSTLINPACPPETQNLKPDILVCNFVARPSTCIRGGMTLCDTSTCFGNEVPNEPVEDEVGDPVTTQAGTPIYYGQVFKAGFDKIDIRFEKTVQGFPPKAVGQQPVHREVMRPTHIYTHRVDELCDFNVALFP